jgi:ferredoxin--NADP+ reductase
VVEFSVASGLRVPYAMLEGDRTAMNRITKKEMLASNVLRMVVEAPEIARRRRAGQFIILRIDEQGERIPLTIADADPAAGTITFIAQVVGKTTAHLATLEPDDFILDLAGPLGNPTHIEKVGTVVGIGGGIGIAPLHPIAQALKAAGNHTISILGARTRALMIMEDELRKASDEVILVTDDGTYGKKGFVTDALRELIEGGVAIDLVVAIGPPIMMKMVSKLTQVHNLKTLVSLNTIMVDGTGMCGGCRVSVGGEVKFVCVDGPEFDGHQVDFDQMGRRLNQYRDHEQAALARFNDTHACRLG